MAEVKTRSPRKQRKRMYSEPRHRRRKHMGSHLSMDLRDKYKWLRRVPVKKGDTVKVLRGSFKDHVGKVATVNTKSGYITVEKATIAKVDGTQIAREIHPSNVIITRLDMSDPYRRRKIEANKEAEE
ncbi:MAG: 50S ribosomal protein L24 [Thermoplasmata archaeon]|nr:MAG: 50S ribosomal protein L24 [Thermoplasmata archaeon]